MYPFLSTMDEHTHSMLQRRDVELGQQDSETTI